MEKWGALPQIPPLHFLDTLTYDILEYAPFLVPNIKTTTAKVHNGNRNSLNMKHLSSEDVNSALQKQKMCRKYLFNSQKFSNFACKIKRIIDN